MNGKQIGVIYFYLVSAASLVLIVIGLFSAINFVVNITQFKDYPLSSWETGSCEVYPFKGRPVPVMGEPMPATLSAEETEEQKKFCEEQTATLRQQRRVSDLRDSITFTLIGLILFGIHFPQGRKQSKS